MLVGWEVCKAGGIQVERGWVAERGGEQHSEQGQCLGMWRVNRLAHYCYLVANMDNTSL